MEVVGRHDELRAIDAWLEGTAEDVLLIEGSAGIGKTTLWRAAIDAAAERGYTILRSAAAQTEAQLPFAVLRDLFDATFDEVATKLPEPQRQALAVTLLREAPSGDAPGSGTIGVALLSALRALGARGPTLVAIDDVQWLDQASRAPIRYALRRLADDGVHVLLARRSPEDGQALDLVPADRQRTIDVRQLSVGAIGHILHTRLDVAYPRPTLNRIHGVSGGSPFFALELARALGPSPPVGSGSPLPVPGSLHEQVDARLLALPPEALDALSVTAIASRPTVEILAGVLGRDPAPSLAAAETAHLVSVDGRSVQFAHPLYAAAVHDLTPFQRRVAIHRALAELADTAQERAQHLAAATIEPDSAVGDVLEAAGREAARSGAPATAAELLEHASRVTPLVEGGYEDGRRAVDAGWYWFVAGDGERARTLLESGLAAAPRGRERGSALIRLGRFESQSGNRRVAIDLFREALAEVESGAPDLEAEIHEALGWAIHLTRGDALLAQHHAQTAIGLAESVGDDNVLASALVVLAQSTFFSGGGLSEETFARAFMVAAGSPSIRVLARPDHHRAFLLLCADRLEEARSVMVEVREQARMRGDETALPWILMRLSQVELYAGNWALADDLVAEGLDIALHAGQRPIHADLLCTMALFAAHRGEIERARSLAEEGVAGAVSAGTGIGAPVADSALAMLDLSLGDAEACARRLAPLHEASERAHVVDPGVNRYVPDLAEALVALDRLEEAEVTLSALEERSQHLERPSVQAVATRGRGLLLAKQGDNVGALAALATAVDLHGLSTIPFEQGRTLLVLGEHQRRARQRRAARASLERALAFFDELGAKLWTARARDELRHISGRAASTGDLTPAERRVADLVAAGKSNKEVAAELVISVNTVESTLTSVYRKLDVRSRTQLAHRIVAPD